MMFTCQTERVLLPIRLLFSLLLLNILVVIIENLIAVSLFEDSGIFDHLGSDLRIPEEDVNEAGFLDFPNLPPHRMMPHPAVGFCCLVEVGFHIMEPLTPSLDAVINEGFESILGFNDESPDDSSIIRGPDCCIENVISDMRTFGSDFIKPLNGFIQTSKIADFHTIFSHLRILLSCLFFSWILRHRKLLERKLERKKERKKSHPWLQIHPCCSILNVLLLLVFSVTCFQIGR